MHLDKSILREEGYIGEELMKGSGVSDLERKCFVIKQTVTDGDLTLEQALEAYGVSKEEFTKYLSKHVVSPFTGQ